jgi:hypothetical protein
VNSKEEEALIAQNYPSHHNQNNSDSDEELSLDYWEVECICCANPTDLFSGKRETEVPVVH